MDEVTGKYHGRFRTAYANFESITVRSPSVVVTKLKRPYAPFLRLLTVFDSPILPRHVYQGEDADAASSQQRSGWDGTVQVPRMGAGRPHRARAKSGLLEPVYLDR